MTCGVIAIGVGKGFAFPGERCDPIAHSRQQHIRITEARQVEVLREVVGKLLDADRISTPERHLVQFEAQVGASVFRDEQAVVLQLA